jgi:DNA-binding NtrC family response regulator
MMTKSLDRSGELATMRTQEPGADAPDTFSIVVVEGPDAGAAVLVDAAAPSRVLVGTSPVCSLRLRDERVSRRHASLRSHGRALVLTDLSSTNGTCVSGVSVREAMLHGGEAVRVGRSVLSVMRGAPAKELVGALASFGRVLGESRAMRGLYAVLAQLAASDHPVLLEGEPGVGKELCAEEIHARSHRAARSFAILECNALPEAELGPRLFGNEGLLASTSEGTVFVDEVGALPVSAQIDLLRAIQTRRDVRLVVATRRDLDREVTEGRFLEELLSALAPTRVEIPPLREREGDVAVLARAFWSALVAEDPERGPELPADFLPRFVHYGWPDNVRELAHAVSSRFFLGQLGRWRATLSGPTNRDAIDSILVRELPLGEARRVIVDDFERRYVAYMLARHGSTRDAARASGVALRYFQLLRARIG